MTREEALNLMKEPAHIEDGLVEYYKKRLNLSDHEFERLMKLPKKHYSDFKTYKKTFEILRPFFYVMAKLNFIPWSFYMKYTIPDKKIDYD